MANMELGSVVFNTYTPDDFTLPQARKVSASIDTYGGVAFFSWGLLTIGQTIELNWEVMDSTLFAALEALYATDATVLWKPQISATKGYNVEIIEFTGKLIAGAENTYRRNVILRLLIVGEVTLT